MSTSDKEAYSVQDGPSNTTFKATYDHVESRIDLAYEKKMMLVLIR